MPPTTPLAMSGATLLARTPSTATVYADGDLLYMVMAGQSRMSIILRTADELFTTFVDREARRLGVDVVVNGNYYDVNRVGLAFAVLQTTAGPGSRTTPEGRLVQNQQIIGGISRPNHFYFAESVGPEYGWTFGFGDPPTDGQASAMGGVGPMIINGLKYGDGNVYQPGTPPGAPTTGDPPPGLASNLIQRNNATFKSFNDMGARRGKTVIAYSSSDDKLVLVHQPENASTGITLEALRDKLAAIGVDNAVFLDGGNSAMLMANFNWYTRPGDNKNRTNTIGVAFDIAR